MHGEPARAQRARRAQRALLRWPDQTRRIPSAAVVECRRRRKRSGLSLSSDPLRGDACALAGESRLLDDDLGARNGQPCRYASARGGTCSATCCAVTVSAGHIRGQIELRSRRRTIRAPGIDISPISSTIPSMAARGARPAEQRDRRQNGARGHRASVAGTSAARHMQRRRDATAPTVT